MKSFPLCDDHARHGALAPPLQSTRLLGSVRSLLSRRTCVRHVQICGPGKIPTYLPTPTTTVRSYSTVVARQTSLLLYVILRTILCYSIQYSSRVYRGRCSSPPIARTSCIKSLLLKFFLLPALRRSPSHYLSDTAAPPSQPCLPDTSEAHSRPVCTRYVGRLLPILHAGQILAVHSYVGRAASSPHALYERHLSL